MLPARIVHTSARVPRCPPSHRHRLSINTHVCRASHVTLENIIYTAKCVRRFPRYGATHPSILRTCATLPQLDWHGTFNPPRVCRISLTERSRISDEFRCVCRFHALLGHISGTNDCARVRHCLRRNRAHMPRLKGSMEITPKHQYTTFACTELAIPTPHVHTYLASLPVCATVPAPSEHELCTSTRTWYGMRHPDTNMARLLLCAALLLPYGNTIYPGLPVCGAAPNTREQ